MDRAQARREDAEAIARLVNAVTVAEIAFRSTVEEVRDGLTSPLGANEGVIVAAGLGVKPVRVRDARSPTSHARSPSRPLLGSDKGSMVEVTGRYPNRADVRKRLFALLATT